MSDERTGDAIDYGGMMHDAMRGLVARVLRQVAAEGLPGDHHFFITFDTTHPGVALADWLRERYPEEMTVVLQHWFEGLEVRDDAFTVTLNFGDSPEPMEIPWAALRTFVDPSVEFGLRFESRAAEDRPSRPRTAGPPAAPKTAPRAKPPAIRPASGTNVPADPPTPKGDAEVVQLDKFRK